MAGAKRSYGDRCGIARALDVVGERWALLVVRELLLGPKRFTDLRAGLPKLGPDVLSQRLRDLEEAGIVRRGKLPPPAASRIYELTERGKELEPVILGLGRWGSAEPFPDGDAELGGDAAVLALKTMFNPGAAGNLDVTYELRFGENVYTLRVAGRTLTAVRGSATDPDVVIATDTATLVQLLWRGLPLAKAQDAGDVTVVGKQLTVLRFLKLFAAPAA
jgi:DNA-binding HxlR family transcriptional regulator